MFLLKKLVSPFFHPLGGFLLLAVIGLWLLWFSRKQRSGKALVTVGLLGIAAFSYGPVAGMLATPLERAYPPIRNISGLENVRWVVVLAGGASVDPELPESCYLPEASWQRLMEGVRLYRELPGSRLLLTGGEGFGKEPPTAEVMADMARMAGVPRKSIVAETASRDTREHPLYVKEIVGSDRFVMVTSATHMPRAMALFRSHGLNPVPAPTDYISKVTEDPGPGKFFPDAGALEASSRAVHEYVGIVWARIRGQVKSNR